MKQPSFESLVGRVECDAFAGVDALVIGGSRGLGEVATKLLAAGGARVAFTYHRGVREAVALSAEIDSSGERVRAFALDVRDPGPAAAPILSWLGRVSHLLYFASGPIFVAERGVFDSRLFRSFCDVYVTGFVETVAKFGESGLTHVLYPSSSALDELPLDMGEYVAAKAAGEVACAYLAKTRRGLVVDAPRLPRLATDQTRSLVQVTDATPETLLAPILRAMRP